MSNVFAGEYWSIQSFVSGFSNNAYLITCARTGNSVIVDTPADPFELIEAASSTNLAYIVITHGHQDHVEGFNQVSPEDKLLAGIGEDDRHSLPTSIKFGIDVKILSF